MGERVFAAIDLGASGGRVIAGVVGADSSISLVPVHRFPNGVTEAGGHLRWNLSGLFDEVLIGLERLVREFPHVESLGVDTWGVDYGLLDDEGRLLADPIAYRDARTDAVHGDVHARIPVERLYEINGLQFLPFTTLYQLAAERASGLLDRTAHVVLLPDLIAYWLTGELRTELTNASTTGLLDARTRAWSSEVLDAIGIPADVLPPLQADGARRGGLTDAVATRLGVSPDVDVTTVASHDTASAVAAIPATDEFAYVVSGTWSLVGVETDGPILTDGARRARFTNELGVDGTVRFLRNVGGLWLLQECMRTWKAEGNDLDLPTLLDEAANEPTGALIDVDDPAFIAPDDMPARIAAAAAGAEPLRSPAAITRCVLDSLAQGHAATLERAAELTGRSPRVLHLVGGGSQNDLLCRLTAEATATPVLAGPVETTALGNVVLQARARGALPRELDDLRARIASSHDLRRYEPGAKPTVPRATSIDAEVR